MISWGVVLSNSVWLVGLALLLAGISYSLYNRAVTNELAPTDPRALTGARLLLWGGLIFFGGMALTAGDWIERGVWVILCLPLLWQANQKPHPSLSIQAQTSIVGKSNGVPAHARLRAGAEWLIKLELLWLALLAPFLLFPTAINTPLLIILPLLWLARRLARGYFVPATPFDTAILILLTMVMVSLLVTFDPVASLGKVTGVLLGISLYYALVDYASSRLRLRRVLVGFALGGALVTVVGLLGANWIDKFRLLSQLSAQIPAILRDLPGAANGIHPNEVAGTLLWIVPLQLALLLADWPGKMDKRLQTGRFIQLLQLGALLLSAATLLLTQSRSALLGITVALLVVLWAWAPRARIISLAMIVLAVAAIMYIGPAQLANYLIDSIGPGVGLDTNINAAQGRLQIWAIGIAASSDFPFTGLGMNGFRALAPVMYPLMALPADGELVHAHNEFLQAALDLGLPGLVSYLTLWFIATALVLKAWQQSQDHFTRCLASGIGAALLAHFIFALTDAVALGAKPGVFFWALLAFSALLDHEPATKLVELPRFSSVPEAVIPRRARSAIIDLKAHILSKKR